MAPTVRVSPAPGVSIVHGAMMDAVSPNLSHRDGGILFRTLFEGDKGDNDQNDEVQGVSDRANNYILFLSTQHAFQSPVHHHNFEQFRYAIKGDVSLGPGAVIHQDELAFTGEGVYYGPQKDDENERVILILQYGGCSGQGFTSPPTLKSSNQALQRLGTFRSGKYHPIPPSNTSASTTTTFAPIDGYQALWEHANSPAKLVYPAPQYDKSLVIKPQNFSWRPLPAAAGGTVSRRHLGTFTQREVRVQQWRIEPGADMVLPEVSDEGEGSEAEQLLFVLRGKGRVMGEVVERETAVRVRMGAKVAREGSVRIVADAVEARVESDELEGNEEGEDGAMVLLHWILPRI